MTADRRSLLDQLRAEVKASRFTYADIAQSAGVSSGWVGEVLRGNYPYRDACQLPKNIADSLAYHGLKVHPEISTHGGGQTQDLPEARGWLAQNAERLSAIPHPDSWRATKGETMESYLLWMLEHAGQEKRVAALEVAREALVAESGDTR